MMDDFDFGLLDDFDIDVTTSHIDIGTLPTIRVERRLSDDRGVEYTESSIPKPLSDPFNSAWAIHLAQCEAAAYAEDMDVEIAKANDEIKRIQASVAAAITIQKNRIVALKDAQYDYRVEARRLSQQYYQAMRELRRLLSDYTQQQSFKDASAQFDADTSHYYWREFALPHQIEGAKILASQGGGILGDKMGLGKTLTSLITADMLKSKRLLVVVPADVIRNYEREIAHWAPHRQVFPLGRLPKAQRSFILGLLSGMDEFVVTVNYEAWRRDETMIAALTDLAFDMVILDEAHVMKGTSSTAAKGVTTLVMAENICPMCGSRTEDRIFEHTSMGNAKRRVECLVCDWNSQSRVEYPDGARRSIKHVLPMTGTPILNKPEDLYPLLHLIAPGDFYSVKSFREDYLSLDYFTNKYTFRHGGMESLAIKLGSRMVSRDRHSAGVTLPKQTVQVHDIDFDALSEYPKQRKVIKDLSEHAGIILDNGDAMSVIAQIALITRQRQANVWPAGIQIKDPLTGEVTFSVGTEIRESLKLDRVETLIDDYSDERIVVFSQFKTPLRELERRLNEKGIRVGCFDGDTPESMREIYKLDFDRKYTRNGEHQYDVMLCNYKTGGVGLNFTNATQTIFIDEEWGPGKAAQAMARTDRVGQTEESQVHILRITNTIDDWMASLIQDKADMINGFESQTNLRQEYLKALKNGMGQ